MPAANKRILRLIKAKTGLVPIAIGIGIVLGTSLSLTSSKAFADNLQTLSLANATLSQNEAAEAVAHSSAALATSSAPVISAPDSSKQNSATAADVSAATNRVARNDTPQVASPMSPSDIASLAPAAGGRPPAVIPEAHITPEAENVESAAPPQTPAPKDLHTDVIAEPKTEAPLMETADASAAHSASATQPPKTEKEAVPALPSPDANDLHTDVIAEPETKAPLMETADASAAHSTTVNQPPKAEKKATPGAKPPEAKIPHTDVFAEPKADTNATAAVAPLTPADSGAIRPEQARAWAEELQLLERENQVLRDKVHVDETDPLADIKVDAVTQIREDVLRKRVIELEKELDKLHMKRDSGDLPQKSAPTHSPISSDATPAINDSLPPLSSLAEPTP